MKITRREALRLGLLGGSFLLLPLGNQKPAWAQTRLSPQIQRFELSFHKPPVLEPVRRDATTDYYELTMEKSLVEILPGLMTEIWGYKGKIPSIINGISPGPTIRQRGGKRSDGGRQSVVRFINQLGKDANGEDIQTVTHLHGMASLPQYDGHAEDLIPPGYFKDYIYPNDRAATIWYHDHAIDKTSRNVYMGLAGMYIVEDQYELSLPLPKGDYDVPLILQDKFFATDGELIFDDRNQRSTYGDVILVNGVPWPRMEVANRKYRFRALNASASRNYQLALSRDAQSLTIGDKLIVIGSDGGLLSEPVEITTPFQNLRIGMAERYEFIIDFSQYPLGTQLFLRNVGFSGSIDNDARTHAIMRFDVVREEPDDSIVPDRLRAVEPIPLSEVARTRTFRFERNQGQWKINNKTWDKNRVDANPGAGDVEIWNLVNPGSGWVHPVHIHLVDLQLLDRNGISPRPYEKGWKDVFHVGEFETLRVIAKFGTRDGKYIQGKFMMHCHNLVHEDHSMMTLFEVGKGGPSPFSAPAQPVSTMLPL
ncbi:MAG: multicopper oxidase domain-containing protein [Symploca sp. SIO1C4]|uniref:Multicopper oxidase domain-containing protein n=1 Tax=Symploca sp. SIO1C4 TaxID=2607765 RepID=A0A6B3NEM9_9CYAN|nr:multicopper oxidase domain-containing protein [Symploca sp. SIO1C4]NET08185.1 multicopper oxidase domain-containing protein [Symploca sp. SIO2B6]